MQNSPSCVLGRRPIQTSDEHPPATRAPAIRPARSIPGRSDLWQSHRRPTTSCRPDMTDVWPADLSLAGSFGLSRRTGPERYGGALRCLPVVWVSPLRDLRVKRCGSREPEGGCSSCFMLPTEQALRGGGPKAATLCGLAYPQPLWQAGSGFSDVCAGSMAQWLALLWKTPGRGEDLSTKDTISWTPNEQ